MITAWVLGLGWLGFVVYEWGAPGLGAAWFVLAAILITVVRLALIARQRHPRQVG